MELDWQRIDKAFRGGRAIPGLQVAIWDNKGNLHVGVTAPTRQPNPIIKWLMGKGYNQIFAGQGFTAGEEFVSSVEEAAKIDAVVVLGDRDFGVSMMRLSEASKRTDVRKLLEADKVMGQMMKEKVPNIDKWGISNRPSREDVEDFIEGVKSKEIVDELMGIFRKYAPEVYTAMVKERDEYMAKGINALALSKTTVAVMELAHVNGVARNLSSMEKR